MIVRELNTLMREANYLLIFIPVINYVYISTLQSSQLILVLSTVSCVISGFVLNFTIGYPEPNNGSNSSGVPQIANVIYVLSLAVWVVLWGYSVFLMYDFIGKIIPSVLFFASIAWSTMLLTHILLDIIEEYDNDMYGF